MSDDAPSMPGPSENPLLSVAEAAARAGIQPSSWRAAVARGYLPQPDDPDADAPKQRRRPRWHLTTVDQAITQPLGQGRRTDLTKKRKEDVRRRTAELSTPAAAAPTAVQDWLRANHQALLAVADALVDCRDEIVAATADPQLADELAAAIDQAGEAMSNRPSRILASAVTYAQFLLRPEGAVRVPWAAREVLNRHANLHAGFNALRGGTRPQRENLRHDDLH